MPLSQRRQLFSEYQAQAAKRERIEKRMNETRARERFRDLLGIWAEKGELDPDISFKQMASVAGKTDWWEALEVDELDEIFQDFMAGHESDARNRKREKRHQMMRDLFQLLQERWGDIPTFPAWRDAELYISQNETKFGLLDNLDRFDVFEDFIREKLNKRREDKRRYERREGRKRRDAFTNLMESMKEEILGDGDPLNWEEVHKRVKNSVEYTDLIGTRNSSQPYDIFAERRSAWKREADGSGKRSGSCGSVDSDTKRLKQ